MSRHTIAIAVAAFVLTAGSGLPAIAAPIFVVNSTADGVAAPPLDIGPCETAPGNNVCTLRAAIMKANNTPGGGATIRFGLPGIVTHKLSIPKSGVNDVTTGDINVTASMTIIGNGSSNTIIDGEANDTRDRIFDIGADTTVKITGVTLEGGGTDSFGGALANAGTLAIERSIIRRNTAHGFAFNAVFGGGIYHGGGSLLLSSVTIASNWAGGGTLGSAGGGIYSIAPLTIIDSTIIDNMVDPGIGAGGILSLGSPTTILRSTISGNIAVGGAAGGIAISGDAAIIDSTVSDNASDTDAGGIRIGGETPVRIHNTTIAHNRANRDQFGSGVGGGIFVVSQSTVNLLNSIVAYNTYSVKFGEFGVLIDNECHGTVSSAGPNLFGVSDPMHCTINGEGALYGDAKLLALADNGGPTKTHALGVGSLALDAGAIGGCNDPLGAQLTSDQRGAPRNHPAGGRCDLGAFEAGPFFTLDVDASLSGTRYDPLTDGLLILRYLFGITGTALTAGATAPTATRSAPADIKQYLDGYRSVLDIDDNGVADALTDGLLILRHLFTLSGATLTRNAVGAGANRNTSPLIETYLQTLKP